MEAQYIYNLSIHCDPSCAQDVLYYVQKVLLPQWREYPYWHEGRLLRVHLPAAVQTEEMAISYALQFVADTLEPLETFDHESDPSIQRIREVYADRVLFTSTILSVIG
ncbi:MAG: DUF4286 family protein [Porphyromonas sp.]|nr:DUF4286 family protein [Porphyromonas sp.]